jgi:hypothetical protein
MIRCRRRAEFWFTRLYMPTARSACRLLLSVCDPSGRADRYRRTWSEEELYWALRGGGGNFGVVTAIVHRLHGLLSARSGILIYPFAEAKAILRRCADTASSRPGT